MAQLIDKRYAEAWREIDSDAAGDTASMDLKRPAIFTKLDQYAARHPQPERLREPEHTTHYSVVDAEGNAVAVTTTLNDSFGSRVTAEGLGLPAEQRDGRLRGRSRACRTCIGLIQGPANAVGASKRPLSAMTPTIVLKDGKLFLVLGSPGGPTHHYYGGECSDGRGGLRDEHPGGGECAALSPSVAARQDHAGDNGISPDTLQILEEMGHKLKTTGILGRRASAS